MSAPVVLNDNDVYTITNALSVAAESCERHAVEAEQAAIRDAFEDSAKSYRRVLSWIIEADTFRYDADECFPRRGGLGAVPF